MSTDSPPREPSAYRPTQHFSARFHDRYDDYRRQLSGEVVRRCIEEGDVYPHPHNSQRRYFRETIGAVTFRLVVDVVDGLVITGYPIGVDPNAARDKGYWSAEQIEDVLEFLRAKSD